jgi:hypothetical protein
MPCFPVNRAAAGAFAAAGRFGDAPVDQDVLQFQADDAVIGFPRDGLQLLEDAQFYPLVAAPADRGGAAGAVRDPFAGAVEAACLEKLFEDDPVRDPGPVAAQRVGGVIAGPVGQQRGKLVPQRFDQP